MQEADEDDDDEDGDAPKRGQKRLKRSRFVDDIAAVDEEEDDEEEEVNAVVRLTLSSCERFALPLACCRVCHPGGTASLLSNLAVAS